MVITFDNSESALNALDQLKVSKQEYEGGKKILGESMTQIQYCTRTNVHTGMCNDVGQRLRGQRSRILCKFNHLNRASESLYGNLNASDAAESRNFVPCSLRVI